ncbi:MAG: YtxH domain-containing protein [Myxococcales bacterium]|nr:YtxH domain-containing protein [Myxococcales bacterium]
MNTDTILKGVTEKANEASEVAHDMTAAAKSNIGDTVERLSRVYATLRRLGLDDVLGTIGLQRKHSSASAVALGFGAGFLAGAGTALVFAPMSGRATRRMLASSFRQFLEGGPEGEGVKSKVEGAVDAVKDKVDTAVRATKKTVEGAKDDVVDLFEKKDSVRSGLS